jgi:hypothetical protein
MKSRQKEILTKLPVGGIVEKRLFDTKKLSLVQKAIESGITDKVYLDKLVDLAAKPLFKTNFLWRIFRNLFGVDLKIPFLFGFWTTQAISHNLITTRGKQIIVDQVGGITTAPVTAIALGTSGTSPAAGDTALGGEITTNGGARGAASISHITTTTTYDTLQFSKTFNFTGSLTIQEEGLFDNNSTGGNMLGRQTFSSIAVADGDSLQVVHKMITAVS